MENIENTIINLYQNGMSIRKIAEEVDKDRATISKIIKNNNIQLRPKTEQNSTISLDIKKSIAEYYQKTLNASDTITKFNIGKTTLWRILKEFNVILKDDIRKEELEKNKENIVQDYTNGLKVKEIAKKYKIGSKTVSKLLKNEGLNVTANKIQESDIPVIIELYTNGTPTKEIGEQYNVSNATILNHLNNNNIEITNFTISPLDKYKDEIISFYKEGYSTRYLGQMYNVNANTIGNLLKRHNIKRRRTSETSRIYNFNQDSFEKIDTEEKAYWLGFLYADGNNRLDTGLVRLALADKDKDIVEKFRNFLKHEKAITKKIDKRDNSIMWECSAHSKKMAQDLHNNGMISRKTFKVTFPEWLDKSLTHHFIRGYFDGDGCITGSENTDINNNKLGRFNWHFSLAGTEPFLKKVQEILIANCDLNQTKLTKSKNIFILNYGGNIQLQRIRDYLYKDATVYMDRKKEKFDSVDNYNNRN